MRIIIAQLLESSHILTNNVARITLTLFTTFQASGGVKGTIQRQLAGRGSHNSLGFTAERYSYPLSQDLQVKSDEAHFWLNGYVNKQNCCIWSEANPQVYVETPLYPEKLTVRCALWAGGIIGPYFFKIDEGHNVTVNGDRYRAMITNFFIPELNNHDVQELWFQQDGATCHTARATNYLLKDTFGDRLISRFGPVNWPPRSCDLTPLDYFLWGYVKSLVYADKPQTLDHLEDNIRRVIADIRPSKIGRPDWTTSEPAVAVLFQKSYLKLMPQEYLSNKKNLCQSNNTSLFYCNLKFYTSKKHPLEVG
ncbi:DDE_3 domain-containing protein [Trichonephila clavipes]|nr:DDE_3 domain-containing protein [Trichonephila clavipes]